ncbi:MAG: hydrogenase iron-sulfur subunit [Steroidobacteraceae bacterium]
MLQPLANNYALKVWRSIEQSLDRIGGPDLNPLRQLGALAILAFTLLVVSGIWLYAVLDTSATGAYQSIESLSSSRWSVGGLMRSTHRYAADAIVVITALHLLRELLHGRWRHFRRFSWLTGCVLLPLMAASAIGGFWLNWDQLGQFSAVATAEWLDAWPLLAQPLARNFLANSAVSDRLFSLFVFVHLGVALLSLLGLWLHLQRISRPVVLPRRAVILAVLGTLVVLSLLLPITSQGPADLAQVPTELSFDWILLGVHPLMYATSAGFTWSLVLGVGAVLLLLPFLRSGRSALTRPPIAVVDPANCNGCARCFADCPYAAVTMTAHPDGRPESMLAQVDSDLCASCGICAGACPSSTPFRSTRELVSGIDMPQLPVSALRDQLAQSLTRSRSAKPIVLFACREGAAIAGMVSTDVVGMPLLCSGQLAPSFVDFALRDGAAGVLVASCRDGGCEFRLGARWTLERLTSKREPHLRTRVSRDRVQLVFADKGEEAVLHAALDAMRSRIGATAADAASMTC